MSTPVHITSASQLRGILSGHTVVVMDFYADWCGPCTAIAPVFAQLAKTHARPARVAFVKVNTDELQDVARKYDISADAREVARVRGADPRALRDAVEKTVAGAGAAAQGSAFTSKGHTLGATTPATKYVSGGRLVSKVPITARMGSWADTVVRFVGLYVVSLFSVRDFAVIPGFS
ncbi:MAG: hypothetical protein M1813_002550 [Trichoglossum hirsutum]|nr:MAG: hypothetical protein M1813_002550 [Trichoglossum hirsutum]